MPTLGPGSQIYLKRTIEDLQPVVRTSRPYPLEATDNITISVPVLAEGFIRRAPGIPDMVEDTSISQPVLAEVSFSAVVTKISIDTDQSQLYNFNLIDGAFSTVVVKTNLGVESSSLGMAQVVSGEYSKLVIRHSMGIEEIQHFAPTLLEGSHVR